MQLSLVSLIFLAIAPFAPSIVQGTPAPEPAPAPIPAPEPWRPTHHSPNSQHREVKSKSSHTGAYDQGNDDRYKALGVEGLGRSSAKAHGFNTDYLAKPQTVHIFPNEFLDFPDWSTDDITCNRLASQWSTFEQIPRFPFIGMSSAIHSADSPLCGSCVEMVHGQGANRRTIFVTLVSFHDGSSYARPSSWSVSEQAFDNLVDIEDFRRQGIDVQVWRVPNSKCGH